jgi:hypothetical protein
MTLFQAFIIFLKYNNLLYLFKENKKTHVNYNVIRSVYFFDETFCFSDTKQPNGFWAKVDDTWCDLLYESLLDEERGNYKLDDWEVEKFIKELKKHKI